jgi:acetyl-CoA C-acetyltransferase
MNKVYITGIGMTDFGELWDRDLESLGVDAAEQALQSAGLKPKEIDAVVIANMNGETYSGQAHLGSLFSQALGLDCPAYRIEAACASGGQASHMATELVRSGVYKNVLVIGVEKMTDVPVPVASQGLMGAANDSTEGFASATFPSLYAMMAREHFRKYKSSKEDLAKIATKNHAYGVHNPHAQFRRAINDEIVMKASAIASPLGLFDCSPLTDGAAAIVISSIKSKNCVEIVGSHMAHDTIDLASRADMTSLDSTVKASKKALADAGIAAKEISIAELHDCFTIAELIAYEDIGFAEKGKGASFAQKPTIPVNTSGGLKACGHPVAATGVKQLVELHLQLTGHAGDRQQENLEYGLAQNVGGTGGTAVVTVVRKLS